MQTQIVLSRVKMSKLLLYLAVFGASFYAGRALSPPLQVENPPRFPRGPSRPAFPAQGSGIPPHTFDEIAPRYRLNDSYLPSHYKLDLTVILDNDEPGIGDELTTPGHVGIDFKTSQPTSQILLHVNPALLSVNGPSITVTNMETLQHIQVWNYTHSGDDRHFFTVHVNGNLDPANTYRIEMSFVANINTESLDGLYLSYYTADTGEVRRLAATQMQAYHARQLFPCFDEPGLRATFNLSITHRSNYTTVLGNGDIVLKRPHDQWNGWNVTTFKETVQMPTYLFAMLVSDFGYAEDPTKDYGKDVKTFAPPPVIARNGGNYSAAIAWKMLKFFDEYFDYPYPMDKMDSVHVPHFSAGAMENWSLNLYREAYLIYYPGETLESAKNLLTSVVSHELAHQHFGNLVTCKWWNELWLNEGFATYVSYLGVDEVAPEFRHQEFILNDAFQYSMRVDVSSQSHPIVNDALSPEEVDMYFTGITYEKGGSVNRMTENFLTNEVYRDGLRRYLKEMQFQAVTSQDLFRNLDSAAAESALKPLPVNLTVAKILESWTTQKSHPLVRVTVAGPNAVYISQERYADPEDSSLWFVPVTIFSQDNSTLQNLIPHLWLEEEVPLKSWAHDTSKWIMINYNATGYYRVLYDDHLVSLIQKQLLEDASKIPALSRSQLLDDYFALAFRGLVKMQTALELTKFLAQEDHFTVWEVVFLNMRQLYTFAETEDENQAIKNYLLPKVHSALDRIGLRYDPATHKGADGILWSKLIDWACSLGDDECIHYAHDLHQQWDTTNLTTTIPIDIQGSITCAIVATGGKEGFDFILSKYAETPMSSPLKARLLNALACAQDTALLQTVLDMVVDANSELDRSHAVTAFQRVVMNSNGRLLAIEFMQTNLRRVIDAIGTQGISSVATTIRSYISRQEHLDHLLKFLSDNSNDLAAIRDSLQLSFNGVRSNIAWKLTFGSPMLQWMADATETPTGDSGHSIKSSITVLISMSIILMCSRWF